MTNKLDRRSRTVLLVILTVMYFFIKNELFPGEYFINSALFEIIIFYFIYTSTMFVIWKSRYEMPQVTANGFSGSILERPDIVKSKNNVQWTIFNTGVSLMPFYSRGKLATLIVPKMQVNLAGRNFVSKTLVKRTNVKDLPNSLSKYIISYQDFFNIDNIYYGFSDEEFVHENPDATDHEETIANLNRSINERDSIIQGNNDTIIEMVEASKSITGEKESWWKALRRPKKPEEES